MENKKPLIIVPPMSVPMTKLKEILEGIATEENIEIFTVTDSKEFAQLVGSSGQALVILCNAKICATLLQENKSVLSKNHSKVILLTPKEIPAKTLIKFTKIGLTESILETAPPKTLLYKVKLLLRSIKVVQKEETSQQVIKSMLDTNITSKSEDELLLEKAITNQEENAITNSAENKKKKPAETEESNLDYLSNLTGKTKYSEESIETHWKSKKDRKSIDLEENEDANMKTKSSEDAISEIDMYYRGKNKKNNTELEISNEEDIYKREKLEDIIADYDLKKHRTEIQEEDSPDKKPSIRSMEEAEDEITQKKSNTILEEDSETDKKEKQNSFDEVESKKKDTQHNIDEIEENKESKNKGSEDLGGHLKGKLKKEEIISNDDFVDKKVKLEDTTEEKKKKNEHDVQAENSNDANKKEHSIEEDEEKDAHEGETDNIDQYMRGDLETTEAIKTRMEANSEIEKSLDLDEEKNTSKEKNELLNDIESEEKDRKSKTLEDESSDTKNESRAAEEDLIDKSQSQTQNKKEEESEYHKRNADKIKDDEKDKEQKNSIELDNDSDLTNKRSSDKQEENTNHRKRDANTTLLEENQATCTHEGQTDKISTYYRSDDSKNKDQDWNLRQERKNTVLDIEKTMKEDIEIGKIKKGQYGEETINYKKLKEEFDQIARGENTDGSAITSSFYGDNGKSISAENNFKVIELGPHSFDFAIEIINLLYIDNNKPNLILKAIAEKIHSEEKGLIVFYQYSLKDKKSIETFNSYKDFPNLISEDTHMAWNNILNDESSKQLFEASTMPTWVCRSIPENDSFWRDIELPTWANLELTNKAVELIYPFFDGVDRMGYAHVLFVSGINPQHNHKIQIAIEMARCVFLDSIQRKKNDQNTINNHPEEKVEEKQNGKVMGFLNSFLGKKKAS